MSRFSKLVITLLGILLVTVLVLLVVQHYSKPNLIPPNFVDRTEAITKEREAAKSEAANSKSDLPYNTTTFQNNYGTNIINAQTGTFRKSSYSWTITKNNDKFNIKTNAMSGSFNVVYSHYDSPNKLHHYTPSGSAYFDNAVVQLVMTNGKLDRYAAGDLSTGNILSIIFTDNNGYIYKLGK